MAKRKKAAAGGTNKASASAKSATPKRSASAGRSAVKPADVDRGAAAAEATPPDSIEPAGVASLEEAPADSQVIAANSPAKAAADALRQITSSVQCDDSAKVREGLAKASTAVFHLELAHGPVVAGVELVALRREMHAVRRAARMRESTGLGAQAHESAKRIALAADRFAALEYGQAGDDAGQILAPIDDAAAPLTDRIGAFCRAGDDYLSW